MSRCHGQGFCLADLGLLWPIPSLSASPLTSWLSRLHSRGCQLPVCFPFSPPAGTGAEVSLQLVGKPRSRVRVQPVLLLLTQPVDVPRGSACWPGRLRPGIGSPQGGWRGASRGCACRVAVLRRWRRRSQGCLHLDLGEAQGRPGPPAQVPNGPCPRVPKMALDRRPGIADVTPRRFRLLHQGVVEVRVVAVCAVGVVSPPHAPRRFQKQL